MSASRWVWGLLVFVLLSVASGCGYHLTNSPSRPLGVAQTIWIPFFSNESISPTAQTVLRRAFYDELHALRGLNPARSDADADLVMKARLISYSSKAVSFNALDHAREFNLSLDVELEIAKNRAPAPIWKGQIQGSKQYPANIDLALQRNAEDQALDAAARILAQKFISAVEESY